MCDQPEPPRLSSSSSSSSDSRNACVVLDCRRFKQEPNIMMWHEFQIYMVDWGSASASSDEYSHIKPTLRLESAYPWVAFCGLNSTLYMFGGDDTSRICGRRSCATKFKITPEILAQSDYKLGDHNLVTLKSMRRIKYYPAALPTPDGKSILVFSTDINMYPDYDSDVPTADFELYNIDDDSWEMLPPPVPNTFYTYSIKSYGFKTHSHFVIEAGNKSFFLDLSQDCKVWKEWNNNPEVTGYFIGIDDLFFFNGDRVYDSLYGVEKALPRSSFPKRDEPYPDRESIIDPYMTVLDFHKENGCYHPCLVRGQKRPKDEAKDQFRLIMDICSINIEKYKTDMERYQSDKKKLQCPDGSGFCDKDKFLMVLDICCIHFQNYELYLEGYTDVDKLLLLKDIRSTIQNLESCKKMLLLGDSGVYDTRVVQGEKCPEDKVKDEFPLIMDTSSPNFGNYNTDFMSYTSDFYRSYKELQGPDDDDDDDDDGERPSLDITNIKTLKRMVDVDSSGLLRTRILLFSI